MHLWRKPDAGSQKGLPKFSDGPFFPGPGSERHINFYTYSTGFSGGIGIPEIRTGTAGMAGEFERKGFNWKPLIFLPRGLLLRFCEECFRGVSHTQQFLLLLVSFLLGTSRNKP